MATPSVELGALINRINSAVQTILEQFRDNLARGRSEGTPDASIIQRNLDQIAAKQGNMSGIIRGMSTATTQAVRGVYQTGVSEVASGLAVGQPPALSLRNIGFDRNTQGTRIITLGFGDEAFERQLEERLASRGRVDTQERAQVKMMWVAAFVNTCKDCLALAGQVRTLSGWKASGILPGNGNTVCGANCQCHLAAVERLASRFEMTGTEQQNQVALQQRLKNGIKLQSKKIDELEKIRGQKYSASTRLQMMGEVRTTGFNPKFAKRESLFVQDTRNPGAAFRKAQAGRVFRTGN